jgi:hypothetical protein
LWDHHSELIFRGNPNVAPPGSEGSPDLEWIPFYRGNRLYNRQAGDRWIWNKSFNAPCRARYSRANGRGRIRQRFGRGFVVIEPNVPEFKTVAPNKQWPVAGIGKSRCG